MHIIISYYSGYTFQDSSEVHMGVIRATSENTAIKILKRLHHHAK